MYTYLTMISGPKVGASVLLHETAGRFRLGRQTDCAIQLEDPLCSRHHAEIWFDSGHWHIRDLSRNGTFVADQRITEHTLRDGEVIRMGKLEFAFHQSDQPPTTVEKLELGRSTTPVLDLDREDEQTLQASLSSLSMAALDYKELNRLASHILPRIGNEVPDWEHLVLEFIRARLGAARAAWVEVGENFQLIPRRLDPLRQSLPELSTSLKYLLLSDGRVVWASRQSPADARTPRRAAGSDALWAPIAMHGEIIGVLYAGVEIGQFRQSHFDLMAALARLVSESLRLDVENLAFQASQSSDIALAAWPDQLPGTSRASERLRSHLTDATMQPVVALRGEPGLELPTAVKLLHAGRRASGVPLLVVSAEALNAALRDEAAPAAHAAVTAGGAAASLSLQQNADIPSPGALGTAAGPAMGEGSPPSLLFSRRLWWLLERGRGSGAVLWLTHLQRLSPGAQKRLAQVLHRAEELPPASVPIEQQPLAPVEPTAGVAEPARFWLALSLEAPASHELPLIPELVAALEDAWITIPPLRERTEDLEPWLDQCLERLRHELGRPRLFLNPAARAALLARHWPGNVAELQSVVRVAALRCGGDAVDVAHLDPSGATAQTPYDTLQWSTWERRLVDAALHQSGGNIAEAARLLGIGRATLYRKLESRDGSAAEDD